MPTIGTLTVDLVANTATFSGDLGKAAKNLEDFGKSAGRAGEAVDFSMREARGSLLLMEHEIGFRLPREMNTLIASVPGIGIAFEALLPAMGAVFAGKMIFDFIEKNREAADKFQKDWEAAGNVGADALEHMEGKLRAAQLKADELSGDHLGALKLKLEEIDASTLSGIIGEVEKMGKAADTAFKDIEGNWFVRFLMGDKGVGAAKAELDGFVSELVKAQHLGANADIITSLLGADADHVQSEMTGIWNQIEAQKKKMADTPKSNQVDDNAEYARAKQLSGELQKQWNTKQMLLDKVKELQSMSDTGTQAGDVGKGNVADEAVRAEEDKQNKIAEIQEKAALRQGRFQVEDHNKHLALLAKAAKEEERINEEQAKATDMVTELHEKAQKLLEDEATRHAERMAELTAKEGGASKAGEEKRYTELKAALERRRALLTSFGQQRIADEQKIDNKEAEEAQKHQNKMDQLTLAGEQKRAELAKHFAQMTLFENKSLAAALEQTGKQMLSELVANTTQSLMVQKDAAMQERLIDAKSSAVSAYKWAMSGLPFPVNAVVAPIAAGAAFSGVMSFEQGGQIPGHGPVPITAHGGESVVTKALTDRVAASEGRGRGRIQPTNITMHLHGIKDADGFKASERQTLNKQIHAQEVLRKKGG